MNNEQKQNTKSRIFAVLPAAGRSRRMGAPKQWLEVEGRPMLLSILDTLADSSIDGVILVTHSGVADKLDRSALRKTRIAINDDESSEMIDSIRIGIAALREEMALQPDDGLLIMPADQPGLSVDDIERCVASFRAAPERIVIAAFEGRRGHPLIFPAALVDFVFSAECDSGLKALARQHGDRVRQVECYSSAVVRNINTPEDYEKLP